MFNQFLDKDPVGKPALQHSNMRFGGSHRTFLSSLSSCCSTALYHLGCQHSSSQCSSLSCLPHQYQPEEIIVPQFHSVLNDCQINWQERKALCDVLKRPVCMIKELLKQPVLSFISLLLTNLKKESLCYGLASVILLVFIFQPFKIGRKLFHV